MKLDADLAINMFVGDADFDEVTKITDEAAEFLSEQDEILFLDGLTELSDAAAESLSKYQGEVERRRKPEKLAADSKNLN